MNRSWLFPVISVIIPIAAHGQQVLSLEQAKALALERNITVVQAQNDVEAAQANLLAARGGYLPTVSGSAGWTRTQNDRRASSTQVIGGQTFTTDRSFSVTSGFSAGVDAGLTLFDGLRREANVSSASSGATATEQRSMRSRQAVAWQVEVAYLLVLRNEQLVKVSEENLKRDQRQLERITESNRVGALSLADVYRQQSQTAKDELDVINSRNNFDKARADLMALIGENAEADYVVADSSLTLVPSPDDVLAATGQYRDLPGLTRRALAARPDYLATVESFNAADARVMGARSGYFPSISAFAGYSLAGNDELSRIADNRTTDWGLSLRWNLFDAFATNNALQAASVEARNAQVSVIQAERDISVQVKKTQLDLEASQKALDVTQKGLRSAEEDRRIAEERYNLGAGTLLDLLVANANLVSAEASRIGALYDFFIALRTMDYVLGERTY
jgi:outer membrane protein